MERAHCEDDVYFENEIIAVIHIYNVTKEDYFIEILSQLTPLREYDEHGAKMLCEKGDQLMKSWETLGEAVFLYTQAIYMAPLESQWLALSHGNRAVALYKLNRLAPASYDCECALELNHPEPQTIQFIQEKIAASLKDVAALQKTMVPASVFLKMLEEPSLSVWTSERGLPIEDNLWREKKFTIQRSEDRGRFCVADENIEVGEAVLSEKCFTYYWQGRKYRMFETGPSNEQWCLLCDNCLENNIIPFPCYECRSVFYCSRQCREEHDQIHRVECDGYKLNFFGNYDEFHLALRCLVTMFDSVLDKLTRLQQGKRFQTAKDLWFKINETTENGEFLSFFSDFHHFQMDGNVLRYSSEAALYASYLETKTDFFERTRLARVALMKSKYQWQILVATLLLRIRSILVYNEFCIRSVIPKQEFGETSIATGQLFLKLKDKAHGRAVYNRASMINHSCSPNASFRFKKSQIRIFATRRILKGEEITIPYHSIEGGREDRNRVLYLAYGFLCSCAACADIEEPHFKQKNGIVCNQGLCGAIYLPHQEACPRCGHVYSPAFYDHIKIDAELITASVEKFQYLYREYRAMERFLPEFSVKRQTVIKSILYEFLATNNLEVQLDETVSCLMIDLALDLLRGVEAAETKSSATFALVMAHLMDILALREKHGMAPVLISFNYSAIKQSIEFLPLSTKAIFQKYLHSNVANYFL